MKIFEKLHGFIWESMTENNCNTFYIEGDTPILIDPGHLKLFSNVEKGLAELNMSIDSIGLVLCTHEHPDHFESLSLFKGNSIKTGLSRMGWDALKNMDKFLQSTLGIDVASIEPDLFLKEGELMVGDISLRLFHTPGHSDGSICIYWPAYKALFTGDVIFKDGVGRTDFPGGNGNALKQSILKMKELDVELLLPGHGEIIAGKEAVKANFDQIEQFWFSHI